MFIASLARGAGPKAPGVLACRFLTGFGVIRHEGRSRAVVDIERRHDQRNRGDRPEDI